MIEPSPPKLLCIQALLIALMTQLTHGVAVKHAVLTLGSKDSEDSIMLIETHSGIQDTHQARTESSLLSEEQMVLISKTG